MGNINMMWGKTKSYELFTLQRDVAVNFDFFVRNTSSRSVIFFRNLSLTTIPYDTNIENILTIGEVLKLTFPRFRYSKFSDTKYVLAIIDRWWLSFLFMIYLSNFTHVENVSAMLKGCVIDQNSSIDDCLKNVLNCAHFGPFIQCYLEKLNLWIVLSQTKYGRW